MIDVPVAAAVVESVPVISRDTSAVEAAELLRNPATPALLVGDESAALEGIVTESDIVAAVAEEAIDEPVAAFMSGPLVTVGPSLPVGLAADRMRAEGIATLPVLEDGDLVGVATRETLAPYLSRRRLEIDWKGEPLSMDAPEPEAVAE